jgi:membrane associated rhomboid family serine protease
MIPIRDTNRSKNHPVVNNTLIGINVFLFIIQSLQGPRIDQFIFTYGLVPARYTVPELASYFTPFQQAVAFVSFMFLHGGFWHLLGNMWSLYIFGDNVEDRLGPLRYLVFYLLCGWLSGLTHFVFNMDSRIPTIGASGAIAGVMGAYLILYPSSKILTLIPIFFIPFPGDLVPPSVLERRRVERGFGRNSVACSCRGFRVRHGPLETL